MHSFILSINSDSGPLLCQKCKHPEIDHSDKATCESCPNIGPCELYPDVNGMLLCSDCIQKEELIRNSPESSQSRVDTLKQSYPPGMNLINERIRESHDVLNSIQIRSDVFNAQTVAIVDIQKSIMADDSVKPDEKYFATMKEIALIRETLSKAVFDTGEKLIELHTQQQAAQVYWNELANKLRIDQRAKLQLLNIDYKPTPTKISKPKLNGPSKPRFDKAELKKWANSVNAPEAVLQGICVAKNMTPELAAKHYQNMLNSIQTKSS